MIQFELTGAGTIGAFSNVPSRRLLETRGGLIIRKLCVLLQPKNIYVALASVLQANDDLEFIGVMVEVRA